jgi:uncharacterized protein YoxC
VTDPLFWLILSFLFVTVSLTIVLAVAIPALRDLARAARSAEKLFDTLKREFPPTLEAIRLTGIEISNLTDDVSQGVQSAGQVVKQVDQSITGVKKQASRVRTTTRSVLVGVKAAWKSFTRSQKNNSTMRRANDRFLPIAHPTTEFSTHFESASATSNTHRSKLEDESFQKEQSPEATLEAVETWKSENLETLWADTDPESLPPPPYRP